MTNVIQKSTVAVLMLCVTIPGDRTIVIVNLDILGMGELAKVNLAISLVKIHNLF